MKFAFKNEKEVSNKKLWYSIKNQWIYNELISFH